VDLLNLILQLLRTPAILIGLVAFIGLIVQRKTVTQVILGTVKTILGFLILNTGVNTAVAGLTSFSNLFTAAFGVTGVYLDDNIAVGAVMGQIGQEVGLVMILGFLANLLFARFTKAKWIYLTGHKVWHMAGGIALVLLTLGMAGVPLVILGALILGAYMALQPMLLQPFTRLITKTDEYGVAHTMGSMYWLAGTVGRLVGNKEHSIDETKLPSNLEALRDIAVAFSLIMLIMFAVPALFAREARPGTHCGRWYPHRAAGRAHVHWRAHSGLPRLRTEACAGRGAWA
jgi:PTS system ascorbate-specific IIC component